MVHNDIHDDTDAMLVSRIDKGFKFFFCSEVLIGLCVVQNIVAVIRIMCKAVAVAAYAIAVDLLVGSGKPDGIDTKIIEITLVDLFGNTCKVAALEGAQGIEVNSLTVLVKTSAVAVVVACVAVAETVGQQKVNSGVIPRKRRRFCRCCVCRNA